MVSDASKKKALAKKAKQNIKLHGSAGSSPAVSRNASAAELSKMTGSAADLSILDKPSQQNGSASDHHQRTVTGVLSSRPTSRDIKIDGFSMGLNGQELIQDCTIELTIGRRYGLIGANGSGKTNFLQCLAAREVPIPDHMDLYHLHEEAEPSDRTALEAVVDHIKEEVRRLNAAEEHILSTTGPEDERLELIYERLESLDPNQFEAEASKLLHGLGFGTKMMAKATKDMSGGWRMRVALARALFAAPTLLLLDEPTNHLDLEACVWLEEYLKTYNKCLVLISHSQDFLNGVCTNIIWLTERKLTYYSGNYDTFMKTVSENETVQQKKYEKEQDDIKHIKAFIASCGTFANLVKQAKSKQKILDKMEAAGLTPPVQRRRTFQFRFPDCDKLPPPVLPFVDVSFSYSGKEEDMLYRNLEFGIDCDSRLALVGPNGAGKSTLLKLMAGDLMPTRGQVNRHAHLSIGRYHQHSVDQLDESCAVLEFFQRSWPNNATFSRDVDEWRAFIGRYGITGKMQTTKIAELSEGQKSRVVFAMMCMKTPNMLLLDEPTNHLDIEAIDSLAEAIQHYNGGLVLVSHDFRLIDQVAKEIWVCDKKKVERWNGDIRDYKKMLKKTMGL
ncbi:abc transporter [Klebsormidium nitens]|uniref:Abc transporter n=1 Tax=Klebsormidium nitens TaxID=105231 RepID=A0A1Y1IC53_KLENI|nr:abc transporter [Klebsormidium nitens]|eukprot:GAQ87542.1 abc transporter [Klebsormidium nitens]